MGPSARLRPGVVGGEYFVVEIGEWLADEPPVIDREAFRTVLDRVVS